MHFSLLSCDLEPSKKIPILASCEVLVVGGGPAGLEAAGMDGDADEDGGGPLCAEHMADL